MAQAWIGQTFRREIASASPGSVLGALMLACLPVTASADEAPAVLATDQVVQLAAASSTLSLTGDMRRFKLTIPPEVMPDIAFQTASGERRFLSEFLGRIVVLNLWATWCTPCVKEMPALDRLQAGYAPNDVLVLPLSIDRGGAAAVEPFLQKLGIKALGVYLDPRGTSLKALQARGLPTTVIIDRDGREVGRLEGEAAWDSTDTRALIDYFRASSPPKARRETIVRTDG